MEKLMKLEFEFDALEPYMDKETVEIHYNKHHKGYVDKLNDAIKGTELEKKSAKEILFDLDKIPNEISKAVVNNGGGVVNHNLFWNILDKNGAREPSGELLKAIEESFGSFDKFKKEFSEKALKHFASGWVFLVVSNNGLEIIETEGHGNPISFGLKPIMVIDVWEHAYYLKYQNKRAEFIDNFWNILDWSKVEEVFKS